MKRFQEECCGTCIYHAYDDTEDSWLCTNEQSEYEAEWTDYKDHCMEWEPRRETWRPY